MKRSTLKFFLTLLIFLLIVINYSWLDKKLEGWIISEDYVAITRVVDGDTVVAGNETIRLLGINTPERGETYYSEAKSFLESLVLNETVRLEYGKDRKDLYGRTLAYIYLGSLNVNSEIVKEGYANYYFPSGKDWNYEIFVDSWNECLNKGSFLCEKSSDECAQCINLKEFDYKKEIVVFENSCSYSCNLNDWYVKDEGRKKYFFKDFVIKSGDELVLQTGEGKNNQTNLFWSGEEYIWTETGDTIFLFDDKDKLVFWKGY